MKSADWSPDMIIRNREHPTIIFQDPVPPQLEKTRCLYAVQLKSWYDEQYSDWAKRYLREKLYDLGDPDRSVAYMFRNILAQAETNRRQWSLAPSKVTDDKAYVVTECMRFVDFSYVRFSFSIANCLNSSDKPRSLDIDCIYSFAETRTV